jgi:glucose-1-phosphate cytidylyltransferase
MAMKVVLFCGGLGMRLREYSENVPKPLIPIGHRPILWHLLKYYAHYGHKDFILCLGHHGDAIKRYFLDDPACVTNDFVPSEAGRKREPIGGDRDDWRITFVDTGLNTCIGQRLRAVERHLAGEETFLANYADGLSDLPLPDQISHFQQLGATASFLSVMPNLSYHTVAATGDGLVTELCGIARSGVRVNGGFFVFTHEIFRFIREGEDLVEQPFQRLIEARKLAAYRYDGFWQPVDTAKDKNRMDELVAAGDLPWQVWYAKQRRKVS